MKPNQHTPDSRLPWRVVKTDDCFEVWTRYDSTPGSRNNYVIASGIQDEAEAHKIAAAPELLAACKLVRNVICQPMAEKDQIEAALSAANTAIAKATNS